ncbi:MAG: hypothetical protein IT169_13560 [Bryobacterales bacterium]|nr:hypothetical protein [Bryobacterales bacterium]
MGRIGSFLLALVLLTAFAMPALAEDYCFGFLLANPRQTGSSEPQAPGVEQALLRSLQQLVQAGKLVLAGPLSHSATVQGVVIGRCGKLDEASALLEADPVVKSLHLRAVFQTWRGPNGLGDPTGGSLKSSPAAKSTLVTLPFILLRRTGKGQRDPSLKTMRKEQEFLGKLRRRNQLRMDGAFLGQPDHPYQGAEPGALLVFAAMPLKDAIGIAKHHPLVKQGYATIDALEWQVSDETVPLP